MGRAIQYSNELCYEPTVNFGIFQNSAVNFFTFWLWFFINLTHISELMVPCPG